MGESEPRLNEDSDRKRYVNQAPVPSEKPLIEGEEGGGSGATPGDSDTGQPDEQAVGGSHPLREEDASSGAGSGRRVHPFRDETGSEDGVRKPPARH
jgi:hypothetical protein